MAYTNICSLWYINNIANLSETKVDGMAEHFKYNTEFALSLKNFIESDEFNIQEKYLILEI